MPVAALQDLWSICNASEQRDQIQFIAIFIPNPYNLGMDFRPGVRTPADAIDSIRGSHLSLPHYPYQDLTNVDYPIVFASKNDWGKYIGEYMRSSHGPVPNDPGIAIIDLINKPHFPLASGVGTFVNFLFGTGTIVGMLRHRSHEDLTVTGFSQIKATKSWVDRQISSILGNALTFTYKDLIAHVDSNVLRRFIGNLIETRIGKEFQAPIENYLLAYLQKGVKPPAAIAPAILNMADDYLNARTIDLRAGDHFAIQRHFKLKKSL